MFCFIVLTLAISISWGGGGQGTSKSFSVPSKDKGLMEIYKFFHCIKEGDLQQIEEKLDAGCDLKKFYLQENCSDFQKKYEGTHFLTTMQHVKTINIYPIFFAICYHQPEIIKRLLQNNADVSNVVESVDLTDEYKIFDPKNLDKASKKYTALEVAAYYGDSDMVQMLYKYMNEMPARLEIHLVDDRRKFNLAFINAVKSENTELVSWFLDQGAAIRTCEKVFYAEEKVIMYQSAFRIAFLKECADVTKVLLNYVHSKHGAHLYCTGHWCTCALTDSYNVPVLSTLHEDTSPSVIESKPHDAILSLLESEMLGIPREESFAAALTDSYNVPVLSTLHEDTSPSVIESKPHDAILSLLESEMLGIPREESLAASEMHIVLAEEYSGAIATTFGKSANAIYLKIYCGKSKEIVWKN